MGLFNSLDKIRAAAGRAAGDIAQNAELFTDLLQGQFTQEGLSAVSHGEIFLSEKALDRELRKRLGEEKKLTLEPVRCLEDRIEAAVSGTKLTARVAGNYQVQIEELRLEPEAQHLRMSLLSETYGGENFLGKCAVAVGGSLLKTLVRKKVRENELGRILEFEEEDRVILKLGDLEAIQSLKAMPLPGVSVCALDLVQCSQARHVAGGIQIRLTSNQVPGLPDLSDLIGKGE